MRETDSRPDDEKRATQLRNEAHNAIKKFENQLLSAAFDRSEIDEEEGILRPVPEFLEEEKERLREELYDTLRHLFLNSKAEAGQLSISTYEEAVYARISDRIRRTLGFYQALQRAQEEIRRNNQEIGDPHALEMPLSLVQKLLSGLDEVDFVRQLGTSLGVAQADLDLIVENVITKEFGPLRRRSGAKGTLQADPVGRSARVEETDEDEKE